jgi:hypothetical protein
MSYKLNEMDYGLFMKKVKRDFKTYHKFRPDLDKMAAKHIWEESATRVFIAYAKEDKNNTNATILES